MPYCIVTQHSAKIELSPCSAANYSGRASLNGRGCDVSEGSAPSGKLFCPIFTCNWLTIYNNKQPNANVSENLVQTCSTCPSGWHGNKCPVPPMGLCLEGLWPKKGPFPKCPISWLQSSSSNDRKHSSVDCHMTLFLLFRRKRRWSCTGVISNPVVEVFAPRSPLWGQLIALELG